MFAIYAIVHTCTVVYTGIVLVYYYYSSFLTGDSSTISIMLFCKKNKVPFSMAIAYTVLEMVNSLLRENKLLFEFIKLFTDLLGLRYALTCDKIEQRKITYMVLKVPSRMGILLNRQI